MAHRLDLAHHLSEPHGVWLVKWSLLSTLPCARKGKTLPGQATVTFPVWCIQQSTRLPPKPSSAQLLPSMATWKFSNVMMSLQMPIPLLKRLLTPALELPQSHKGFWRMLPFVNAPPPSVSLSQLAPFWWTWAISQWPTIGLLMHPCVCTDFPVP